MQKVSLIFATHYLSQAQRLADHTIILQNGKLTSTKRDNIFSASIIDQKANNTEWLIGSKQTLVVSTSNMSTQNNSKIFIDPKCIRIVKVEKSLESALNIWQGVVKKSERVNHSIRITVDCGINVEVLLSLDDYNSKPLIIGAQVACKIEPDSIMFME